MVDFWGAALALTLLLYVLLDGFDIGIGILFPFAPSEGERRQMMDAISPVWDGNETWLVMSGGALFGAFPLAYAILLGAFYLPLIGMLCGLILRGVAFEFRNRSTDGRRWIWSTSFFVGSVVAAFAQGTAVGAFVGLLPVRNGLYAGTMLSWLSPFSLLCGAGLVAGYALLGGAWLVGKTGGAVQAYGYRVLPRLAGALVFFLVLIFAVALVTGEPIIRQWAIRPWIAVGPIIAGAAFILLCVGIRWRIDRLPLLTTMLIFLTTFGTVALSIFPYIVPFSITLADAASPPSSLRFLFWGAGLFVLPITLIYTGVVYFVFRGKIESA